MPRPRKSATPITTCKRSLAAPIALRKTGSRGMEGGVPANPGTSSERSDRNLLQPRGLLAYSDELSALVDKFDHVLLAQNSQPEAEKAPGVCSRGPSKTSVTYDREIT